MKFRRTKNLFSSLALVLILLTSQLSTAVELGAEAGRPVGIPSSTWSSSRGETSSLSTRNGPGLPGQWSPNYNPGSADHLYHQGKPVSSSANARVAGGDSLSSGYSGHGIPSSSWSSSRDETSSTSTRIAPGPVGEWSPNATPQSYEDSLATHNTQPRNLQAAPTPTKVETSSKTVSAPTASTVSSSSAKTTGPVTLGGRSGTVSQTSSTGGRVVSGSTTSSTAKPAVRSSSGVRTSGVTSTSGAQVVSGATRTASGSTHTASTSSTKPVSTSTKPVSTSNAKVVSSGNAKTVSSGATRTASTTSTSKPATTTTRTASTVKSANATVSGTRPVNLHRETARPTVVQAPRIIEEPVHVRAPVVEEVVGQSHVRPITLSRPTPIVEEVEVVVAAPRIVEEAVFEEVVHEISTPVIEQVIPLPPTETSRTINEYNKAEFPGLIFGVDEEVEIERCYYEEVEYIKEPDYEEIYEEGVIATPFGTEVVRSPTFTRMTRPAMEHDEVYQRCAHKTIIAPTSENGVRIPQVRFINITQIKTGTFEWPVVRRAQVLPRKTVEKTVEIPQLGFVDLCQDHPTNETAVSIPIVHTVNVPQIVHTEECEVSIPQVHTIWIPIMGDVNIVQHATNTRRVHLKQEWDCTIKCEDTRVHFLKIPQKDEGVTGTVIKNAQDDQSNICHNCHNSKCAGVGPALMPFLLDETPVVAAAPARVETKYVEVIKEVPIPCPEPETIIIKEPAEPVAAAVVAPAPPAEPTEIHHITLGQCPCSAVAVNQPVQFLEEGEAAGYAGWFPWWLLPLLLFGLLGLAMLLAWLLCAGRKRREVVAAPIQPESPKKKFVIEKRAKEEDEEEIEREIARQLQQRVEARAQSPGKVVEEEKKLEQTSVVRTAAEATAVGAAGVGAGAAAAHASHGEGGAAESKTGVIGGSGAAGAADVGSVGSPGTKVKQDRPASPGGSHRSGRRSGSSRGSGSSKKVVKKRIVKMMKQGKLVAEKEEILDEEGNVIRTEIRKEGLSSGSPARSQS